VAYLKKITKSLCDKKSPGGEIKPRPEYKGVLTTKSRGNECLEVSEPMR
jgi:hypothetical protein